MTVLDIVQYVLLSVFVPDECLTMFRYCAVCAVVCVCSRRVFNDVDPTSHAGHMKAAQQILLDGTSKWSARICVQGTQAESSGSVERREVMGAVRLTCL